ncbi:phospholipase D-like domain-containing protein [Synoicihabitans lomoniglobus]|uniref:Phospholipase D-like domain-containing protein n=1 Tax=Synoicihabitans lomoniglobus TaxID=2909285 RepID=A0AAE9ZV31_9BACT|nr:phospholipase D-like domain-containing protein [Opitutaceae bacterium LMO-M01]WED64711.1 phospholipase D-like domain-containing protein [Opitutaceae bacterium LMO-M01]
MNTLFIALGFIAAVGFGWMVARARDHKHLDHRIEDMPAVADPQFLRVMAAVMRAPFCTGNRVQRLRNGDEIFPAMIAAIESARDTICFETYVYWSGDIAQRVAAALRDRARAGVQVNILLDWVGSIPMDDELVGGLRDAGCEVRRFHRPNWRHPSRLNHRTHRKLLIVDGRVGFTGGVGISDNWTGDAGNPDHWRDTHFQVSGPVVGQLQSAFMVNWIRTTGKVESDAKYFPPLPPIEDNTIPAHCFVSSPDEGSENARLAFLLVIGAARRRIRLTTPYFTPDRFTRESLAAAARRGVEVTVLVTGPETDSRLSRLASRALWKTLLEAGVHIHEFQPTMLHAKVLLVDDAWVSIGSANVDDRSFRLNDESNLQTLDPKLADELENDFQADLDRSERIDLTAWRHRPWRERLLGQLATVVRSQI